MHADTLKFYKYSPVKKPIYKGKFCQAPFEYIQIDEDGDVMLCDCQLHMPYVIGNIYQNTLQDIWIGPEANKVRQSVLDQDFTYCNWACAFLPMLSQPPQILPTVRDFPRKIKIDLDRSCNLQCPSCRENVIIEKSGQRIDQQVKLYQEIVDWALVNPEMAITLTPLNSGEIFASHSGLAFLRSLIDYPHNNIKLIITTNGTLINRNRELIKNIKHLITDISISVDAATPETYSIVRGGDWQELVAGLEFLKSIGMSNIRFNYCIQKNNWQEIKPFAEFAMQYGFMITYQKLLNWGHWDTEWWHNNNVFDRTRETFNLALDQVQAVLDQYPGKIKMAAELSRYLQQRTESP